MALKHAHRLQCEFEFSPELGREFRTLEEGAEHTLRNPAIMASSAGEVAANCVPIQNS